MEAAARRDMAPPSFCFILFPVVAQIAIRRLASSRICLPYALLRAFSKGCFAAKAEYCSATGRHSDDVAASAAFGLGESIDWLGLVASVGVDPKSLVANDGPLLVRIAVNRDLVDMER